MTAIYADLAGKPVLVTGGATGIGAAIVEALVRQGAHVAFIDLDKPAGEVLAGDLAIQYPDSPAPVFAAFDLADLDAIQPTIARLEKICGPFKALVNNAANDARHSPDDVDPGFWRQTIDVNLSQQFFCAKAVAPGMKANGGGAIINFGSVSYLLALENLVVYQTAKAAIVGLTRSLARDWGADGIRVNTLIPGCIMTPKQLEKWITPEDEKRIQGEQCLKRRLVPEDIAEMVLFLASDVSSACSAQSFTVDGGIT